MASQGDAFRIGGMARASRWPWGLSFLQRMRNFGALLSVSLAIFSLIAAQPRRAVAASDDSGPPTIKCEDGIGYCQPAQPASPSNWNTVSPNQQQEDELAGMYGYGSGGVATFSGGGFRLADFRGVSYTATTNSSEDRSGCADQHSDPIEISYGAKVETQALFALPGEMGLRYTLYYSSVRSNAFQAYTSDNLDYQLNLDCNGQDGICKYVTFVRPDGSSIEFSGRPAAYGAFPEVGGGGLATLTHNSDGTWTLHDEDGTTQTYVPNGYGDSFLTSIKDASGVGWTITRSNGSVSTTVTVTHTDGQSFTAVYQDNIVSGKFTGSTVTLTDPAGNVYTYVTNPYGNITRETLPSSPQTIITYTYADPGVELTEVDYNATPYSYTTYNSGHQATGTHLNDGSDTISIVYSYPAGGEMTATITNPLGHTTAQQYVSATSPSGSSYYRLASVSDNAVQDCGATIHTRVYDSNGNLAKAVDNDGITHTYSYVANGQLQTETEASGTAVARTINYTWDPNLQLNRVLSVTVPGESKTSYTYNAQNRIASITRTNLTGIGTANQSLTTTYAYMLYGDGMVSTMTMTQPSPGGSDHTADAYDAHGNLTAVTDGLGHVTTHSGYNGLGEVGKIVGPNGDETDYTYDARGRVASKTTHPNGTTATWTYGYDGFGSLAKITAPDGEVTTWARDAEQRVKTITHNDKDGTSTETFGYDPNNDVISDVMARGSDVGKSSSYVYDALGRIYQVKGSHNQVLTYAYDGNGNVLSVTDALGLKTSHTYDALDRVSSVTSAAGGITHFTYDTGDHITHVTDPRGLVTGYAWDGLGQRWQQQSPDTGTTNYGYDAYGRLSSFYRADGVVNAYGYDTLNRVISVTAGGITRTYTWDVCTNGNGRLCAASNQGYDSVGYSYSPEGWITGRSFDISGGPSYGLGYAYDNMGHLAAVDYPDGNEALYDHTDGAVADVRMKVGTYNITGVSGVTYRPMDLAMSNWTSYNGLTNAITYDSDLRATAISVPNVESLGFTYDAANRITGIANGISGSQSETLGYDALNRLTTVTSSAGNESYQYDADGNRTYQMVIGVGTSFTYASSSNRLTGASGGINASYGYNADGDMTTINGTTAYQYGPFDRLSNAGGESYRTSAEAQRIFKQGASGNTYFAPSVGGTPMAEYQSQEGAWLDYVRLNGRLVTVITSNGGVYPVHTDQTGRPIAMTNLGNQSIIWQAQNLPFKSNVTTTTWFGFNIGFPGQYYDSESGLWHNGNRDYDADLGRYIESDPIGLRGGINTYAYADDNPITRVDPLGLLPPAPGFPPAGSESRLNNPNLTRNIEVGAIVGAATVVAIANVVGFPEVEIAEGAGAETLGWGAAGTAAVSIMDSVAGEPAVSMGILTLSWGAIGSVPGGIAGYVFTKPLQPSRCDTGFGFYATGK